MNIPDEYLYPVQAAMEQWTDHRVISSVDLENVVLFLVYLPQVLSQLGLELKGHVIRQKDDRNLLTVKATQGGVPLVVFITSDTPTGCMTRFLDLLEDDRLSWRKDRYPWI